MSDAAPAEDAGPITAPIIVKKVIAGGGDGHHGGAWKVAYADFVTAMMAFFLLLWLLGATEENQRKGLADYFAPTLVKLRQQSAGSDGMLGGSSITDVDNYPNRQGQTGTLSITVPRGTKGGPMEGGVQERSDEERMRKIREAIDEKLAENQRITRLGRQVRVMRAPEGIRIDLVDDADFSMFALGTTILTPEARELIEVISEAIDAEASPLILRGHTDSLPWRSGVNANNWSLSAGRAEATRQQLIRTGIPAGRFARIEGVADTEPLIVADPADPRNRRISLLLLGAKSQTGGRPVRGRPRPAPVTAQPERADGPDQASLSAGTAIGDNADEAAAAP